MTKKSLPVWYEEGLKFKCTECGKCCTGTDGYAWLSESDIERLSKHLNLSTQDFLQQYTRFVSSSYALLDKKGTSDCIFLEGNRCQVYKARPKQCRQFPWWKSTLSSEQEWFALKNECEGIDHPDGKHYSKEEIEALSKGE